MKIKIYGSMHNKNFEKKSSFIQTSNPDCIMLEIASNQNGYQKFDQLKKRVLSGNKDLCSKELIASIEYHEKNPDIKIVFIDDYSFYYECWSDYYKLVINRPNHREYLPFLVFVNKTISEIINNKRESRMIEKILSRSIKFENVIVFVGMNHSEIIHKAIIDKYPNCELLHDENNSLNEISQNYERNIDLTKLSGETMKEILNYCKSELHTVFENLDKKIVVKIDSESINYFKRKIRDIVSPLLKKYIVFVKNHLNVHNQIKFPL